MNNTDEIRSESWPTFSVISFLFFPVEAVLKVNCIKNPFQELDSLQRTKKVRNFAALKPVGWYSNQSTAGALGYSIDQKNTIRRVILQYFIVQTMTTRKEMLLL